jgi:hypothetical protein
MNNASLNCDSSEGHETMKKTTRPNERIKRDYFIWLKEAKGRNEASIDGVAKALSRFETYTKFRDFKQFMSSRRKVSRHILPDWKMFALARGSASPLFIRRSVLSRPSFNGWRKN